MQPHLRYAMRPQAALKVRPHLRYAARPQTALLVKISLYGFAGSNTHWRHSAKQRDAAELDGRGYFAVSRVIYYNEFS